MDCAYKLQEYAGKPRRKRSEGKATWPGRKQVWRSRQNNGEFAGDLVTLAGEPQRGDALLQPVMRDGRRVGLPKTMQEIRTHARDQLDHLPASLRRLESFPYPVEIGASLRAMAEELDRIEGVSPVGS